VNTAAHRGIWEGTGNNCGRQLQIFACAPLRPHIRERYAWDSDAGSPARHKSHLPPAGSNLADELAGRPVFFGRRFDYATNSCPMVPVKLHSAVISRSVLQMPEI